ncbi:MAG: adenylate/guanylate cyclase domain-containing protein [Moraxellaceae bacterium]|nr:adenylate/guanylate cyclase domain-containing protein [Moraxellaceae bacterium]
MKNEADAQGWRRYFPRPDKAFWLDLFAPSPASSPHDQQRRARLARYALGAALVLTAPYVLLSALVAPAATHDVIMLNLAGMLAYGCGMWAASLGADRAARMWLMTTLTTQLALLVWLTGPVLGVAVYAIVVAALARVLFAPHEKNLRVIFIVVALLILLGGFALGDRSMVDFSSVPPWLLAFARVANSVLAFVALVLVLGVFDREVLRSEAGLMAEKDRSERLLHVILPHRIATQLQARDGMIADHHPEVSVLFADIAGFTPWASGQTPDAVVRMLEQVFSRFDRCVAAVGAEKIKTIGDAYMVIAGAPDACDDHAERLATLALAFMDEVRDFQKVSGIPLNLRAGIHSGPVIAGVIGTVRFSYDVWGDTVNTASRMESQGEPGRIQITADTQSRIAHRFRLEARGGIDVKGKGVMQTWWLIGSAEPEAAPSGTALA